MTILETEIRGRRSASTADQAAIQWMLTSGKSVSFAVAQAEEIWVATRVVQDADPHWDTNMTVVGSPERIRYLFPNGIPFGWRTAQGQTGARFLKWSALQELRYQREQEARISVLPRPTCW